MFFLKLLLLAIKSWLKSTKCFFSHLQIQIKSIYHIGFHRYYKLVARDCDFVSEINNFKTRILVFNRNFPGFAGGEKHMSFFCKYFELAYPDAEIHLLVENTRTVNVYSKDYPGITELNARFGLDLKKIKILKHPQVDQNFLTLLSSNYDIFLNSSFKSSLIGNAKKNYYNCMFPFEKNVNSLQDWAFERKYDLFLANSKYTENWIKKYWGDNIKTKCVYPPVFSISDLSKRIRPDKKNIIISVGRFFAGGHSKRQDEMIRLWCDHQEVFTGWELHLAGIRQYNKEDIQFIKRIENLAKKCSSVVLHYEADYTTLQDLYAQAKIYWHASGYGVDIDASPSKVEHFGITTVEAMSWGVVPVVIDKGGQSEIVDDGVNGLKWLDRDEWLTKTRRIMTDTAMWNAYSVAAIEKSKKYTIETFYDECSKIF